MDSFAKSWMYAEAASHGMHERPPIDKFPEFENSIYTALENDKDFAYIAEFPDKIVFSFRGTKDLAAWIGDFDAFPLQDPSPEKYLVYVGDGSTKAGYIHCDFYKSWLYYKQTFQEYLQKYAYDKTHMMADKKTRLGEIWRENNLPPILDTGHSRGGALTILSARDKAKNLGLPCVCVAHGAPRVGTKEFCDEVDGLPINYINIHHGYEFTQYLPPEFAGFQHAGKPMKLEEPFFHIMFNKIKDHFYSTTTDAWIKYCKSIKDGEGVHFMGIVRSRVTV